MPCATSRAPRATSSPRGSGARSRTPRHADARPGLPAGAPVRRAHAALRQRLEQRSQQLLQVREARARRARARSTREPVPRKGVRIIRDRFNVPHIYGRTNDDVTWGAGWALAHDRELLLEQARYNARVAVVDAPGLTRDRPDRRPQDLQAERADRARGRRRRSTSSSATASRAAGCCTTSTCS